MKKRAKKKKEKKERKKDLLLLRESPNAPLEFSLHHTSHLFLSFTPPPTITLRHCEDQAITNSSVTTLSIAQLRLLWATQINRTYALPTWSLVEPTLVTLIVVASLWSLDDDHPTSHHSWITQVWSYGLDHVVLSKFLKVLFASWVAPTPNHRLSLFRSRIDIRLALF